jgi:electron transfer flavoprotein alpha subunit
MIALVPVRDGVLPAGAAEAIAECGGRVVLAGSNTSSAELTGLATFAYLVEVGTFEPGRWAGAIAPFIEELSADEIVVLPNSPDGRDLAPRLAFALDRPLFAAATEISGDRVRVARRGGLELHEQRPIGPFVATLEPGARGVLAVTSTPVVESIEPPRSDAVDGPTLVELLPADVQTMDLSEARRIVGGGAGLNAEDKFRQLECFATAIGGVMGATRVVTDRTWVHHDRQIGTTGVVVGPDLYVSFGVSGAVQHTSGLGHPGHILSVNTDPHCPMMAMSDLAIVSDANATLDHLTALLNPSDAPSETADE